MTETWNESTAEKFRSLPWTPCSAVNASDEDVPLLLKVYFEHLPERTIFSRLNDAAQQQNNSSQSSRMPGNISDKRQDRVNELLAEVHRIGQAKHADLLSASFVPNQYGATCRLTSLYLPLKLSLDRLKPPQSAALLRTQLLLPLIGFAATAEGAVDCSAKPFQDALAQNAELTYDKPHAQLSRVFAAPTIPVSLCKWSALSNGIQPESSETSHRRSTEDEIKSPRPLGADILSSQRSSAEQRLDWDKYENQVPSVEENRPTSEVTTASSTLDNTTDEMAGKTEVYRDANIENKANWPVDDNEELDAKRASSSPNPEPLNSDATEEDEDLKSPKEPSERRDLAPELAHTSNKCESPELGRTTRITSPIPENQISRTNDEDGESRRRESQPAPSQTKRRREKGDQGISEEEQNAIRERTLENARKAHSSTTKPKKKVKKF